MIYFHDLTVLTIQHGHVVINHFWLLVAVAYLVLRLANARYR